MRALWLSPLVAGMAACAALAGLDGEFSVGPIGDGGTTPATGSGATNTTGAGGSSVGGTGGTTETGGGGTSASGGGTSTGSGGSASGGGEPLDPCAEPGIVACYRFEGNALDSSPNGHHATASGVSYVPGQDGMAVHHDVGNLIEGPATPLALSPLTIEFWMRPTSLPSSGRVALVDHAGRYGVFILAGGVIQCRAGALVSGGTVPANAWTHVACTFADSQIQIYLDGTLDVAAANTTLDSSPSTIYIASNYPSGEELVGELDEFRIFDFVRSSEQVCRSAGRASCP